MRLDKYLSDCTSLTRSQARKAIARGEVMLDGTRVRDAALHISPGHAVSWRGQPLLPSGPRYLMLHKPVGYVCSSVPDSHPSIFELMPALDREGLIIAGRLDQDTTGLVLVSDDGQWTHRITSPKTSCGKRYRVRLAEPLVANAVLRCAQGILLQGETKPTLPAELEILSPTEARLTLHEGRYHQVKRMMAALGNKVVTLHREQVGGIALDPALAPGAWRDLTPEEIRAV